MPSVHGRGAVPRIRRYSVPTAGERRQAPAVSQHLQIFNESAQAVRLYFTKEDMDADQNYHTIIGGYPTTSVLNGAGFDGPVEGDDIYLKAIGGVANPVVVIWYCRRG